MQYVRPVRRQGAGDAGECAVVYMPHAGSFGYEAYDLASALGIRLYSVVLGAANTRLAPGGDYLDCESLISAIAAEIGRLPFSTLIIVGHSFGASVAFHTAARMLAAGNSPERIRLVISGARPFHRLSRTRLVLAGRDDLQTFLDSTGTVVPVAEDQLVLAECLDQINVHLEYHFRLALPDTPPLPLHAHIVRSVDDAMMLSMDAEGWNSYFLLPPTHHELGPCGHLYIRNGLDEYVRTLNEVLGHGC